MPEHEMIDCHIHPGVDAASAASWFIGVGDPSEQIATLRRAGIHRACGAPIQVMQPDSFAPIRRLNDQALALRDRFPEFYIPGIQVHPRFPEESCAEIERCCGGEGVRWIGELVGYLMGFGEEYASRNAVKIFREAARFGAVINFHCASLDVIERACRAVPEAQFVLAHPGGGREEFLARIALVARLSNLHLDISGSGIDRYGILRKAIDVAGKEKLLFGTDYPINNPAVYVQGALFERLSEEEYAALFHGNFRRLTGIAGEGSGG
jgi:predicted TIM-barrel fold metal-dependent hydrolase